MTQQQSTTAQGKSKSIWWIIGLIVMIAVGVFLAFTLFGGGNEPQGPEADLPAPPPGVPSAIAIADVNLRTGPGINYPSYGVAPKGSVGEVIGVSENKTWWVVKLPTTISLTGNGWVAGEYVQATGAENVPVFETPPAPPVVDPPPPPSDVPTATALDVVNVRSGPGLQYPAYGVAAKGARGEVIGVSEDKEWWVVKMSTNVAPDGMGWVSADWVSTANAENVPVIPAPGQQPPVEVPPPGQGGPTGVALDYLNVRNGPGVQYDVYGVVAPGVSGEIIGKSPDGKWWAVKLTTVDAGRGWVSIDYVQATNVENVPILNEP